MEDYLTLKSITEDFRNNDKVLISQRTIQRRLKGMCDEYNIIKKKDYYIKDVYLHKYDNVERLFKVNVKDSYVKYYNTYILLIDLWLKYGDFKRFITITPRDLNGVSEQRCIDIMDYLNTLLLKGGNKFCIVREWDNLLPHYHIVLGDGEYSPHKIINSLRKEFRADGVHLDIDNQIYVPEYDSKYRKENGCSYLLKSFFYDKSSTDLVYTFFEDMKLGNNGEQKFIKRWTEK